nr:helix-turn-helix domain-containing protein [uncultured Dorea sp.]
MNFGEYFRKLRTEHNMTQREIAIRLGVTRQAISHWENNKNLPDLEMLIQIADTFDMSFEQLLANGNVTNFNTSDNITDITDALILDNKISRSGYKADSVTGQDLLSGHSSADITPDFPTAHPHHRHYTHKEIQRLKLNLLTFCIGAILLFFGVGYVGVDNGMERRIKIVTIICKSYILVPLGFLFIFVSIVAFILFELKHLAHNLHRRAALKKADTADYNSNHQEGSDEIASQVTGSMENADDTASGISDLPSENQTGNPYTKENHHSSVDFSGN